MCGGKFSTKRPNARIDSSSPQFTDSNCFGVLFLDSSSAHAPRTHARYAALHKTRSTSPQRIGVELHERARGQAKHGSTIIRCERERAP